MRLLFNDYYILTKFTVLFSSGCSRCWFRSFRNVMLIKYFLCIRCCILVFHNQAFLWTSFGTASALNTRHSFNCPTSICSVYYDRISRAFLCADATKNTTLLYDPNLTSRSFLPYSWNDWIHESCRFAEQAFKY